MIVSFDLDDTLFVSPEKFKTEEPLSFPFNKIYRERLRLGTKDLFRHYGIKLGQVVNGSRHSAEVQGGKSEPMPSKYPGRYRIDLHIDDDVSVYQNGRTYGFKVFIVGPQDDEWANKIIEKVESISYNKANTERRLT